MSYGRRPCAWCGRTISTNALARASHANSAACNLDSAWRDGVLGQLTFHAGLVTLRTRRALAR